MVRRSKRQKSAKVSPTGKRKAKRQRADDNRIGALWKSLPLDVILRIQGHLDSNSRLSASATCKRWRAILLEKSNKLLSIKSVVGYSCERGGSYVSVDAFEMMTRFMPYIHKLVFKWCACKTQLLLKAVQEILQLQDISVKHLQIKGNFAKNHGFCQRCRLEKDCVKSKIELFSSLLKRCTRLEALDFGFEPDLSRNEEVLDVVDKKIRIGALQALNIAVIHVEPIFYCGNLLQLSKLSKLCMAWDNHFEELVHILSGRSSRTTEDVINMKDLTVVVAEMDDIVDSDISDFDWESLASCQPQLKLKLVLVEDDIDPNNTPLYVHTLLEQLAYGIIPVKKLAVVWSSPDYYSMLANLGMCVSKLEEFTWLCMQQQDPDDKLYFEIPHYDIFEHFTKLKKLELCGLFVFDEALLHVGSQIGRRLQDFIVYKDDVRTFGTYTIRRINGQQTSKIEKAMSDALGRDWKLVKEGGLSKDVQLRAESFTTKMEQVLQRVCNI